MRVPFSNLDFGEEEKDAVSEVLSSGWPSRGKVTEEFESQLGKYLGSNALCVNNGSSALMVALLAQGVKAGDNIAVPDFGYVATATVPAILGCQIVPVDVDPETFNLYHPEAAPHDRCIVTDVAGLPKPPDYHPCVEDAAEALGAEVEGHKTGAEDHLSIFSFQATKQLTTIEGGAIASKDEELIDKCRRISDYGRTKERYIHDILGMNFRITDVQSAIGLVQLKKLDRALSRRGDIANRYRKDIPSLTFQKIPSYVTRHAWWAVIGLSLDAPMILGKLQKAGIDARGVWTPIHRQPCFPSLHDMEFNNADKIWNTGMLLPIFNNMSDEQVDHVIDTINA